MRIRKALLLIGVCAATSACSSTPPPPAEMELTSETSTTPPAAPVDQEPAPSPNDRATMPTEPVPLILGGTTKVADGFEVNWGIRSHRHTPRGGAIGIWRFVLTDGEQDEVVAVQQEKLYAEGRSFGHVWVIEGGEGADEATIRFPDAPAESLTEEDAQNFVNAKLKEHGIKGANGFSKRVVNGVVEMAYKRDGKVLARARICLHTHQVEFEAVADEQDP